MTGTAHTPATGDLSREDVTWSPPASIALARRAAARGTRLLLGLWVFAMGIALMLRANLGLSSWDVLHDAVAGLTSLSFGRVVIGISLLVVLAALTLSVRPGPGTLANVILVGAFTDVILATGALAGLGSDGYPLRLLALAAGIAAVAIGTALYVGAELGAGPRDGLMLAIAKKIKRSPGTARTMIEGAVLVIGIALGGAAGFGTVIFAISIGPAVDVTFGAFGMHHATPAERVATPVATA